MGHLRRAILQIMPPKRPRDANKLAKLIVEMSTGEPNDSVKPRPVGQRKRKAAAKVR